MNAKRFALPLLALSALPACSSPDAEQGLSSAEERQLDEAAAALDEAQADYEAAVQTPETAATDPGLEEQDEH
ncbi:hypothetical protein [Parasphingopyxis marina]|uniref:Secreted protein n=1 Tax=Parasphingopyxis marina TaxID=2761622 RepID=A0A842I0P0_9SPHN|nr:hypothetical protein [Parasphingopyxis marina]MBC2778782.1 hypothetical protein [Parasphingopyxis marina]